QKMRRTTVVRGLGAVLAVLLVIGLAADAYAQSFFDSLPPIQVLDSATFAGDTVITNTTGRPVLSDVGNQGDHRVAVKLASVAPIAIQATVAIEDRGFYTNPGFDAAGIIRAAFDNIRAGHIVGGGSTITQQLAKQQFLTPDQTVSRKIKELALAYELSQTYSKDQIMELYLNKSFYGSQSYGIEADLLLADQPLQGAALRGLRSRGASPAWLPARHPAAERADHARLQHADDRRVDREQQPCGKHLAGQARSPLVRPGGRPANDWRHPGHGRVAELQLDWRPDQLHDDPPQHGFIDEALHVRIGRAHV